MRCCFSTFSSLFGWLLLIAAGYFLYVSFLDKPELLKQTLGGASELAVNAVSRAGNDLNNLDLPVTADGSSSSSNIQGGVVAEGVVEGGAMGGEVPTVEGAVINDATNQATDVFSPEAEQNVSLGNPAQNNEILTSDTEVSVVGLAGGGEGGGQGGDGQGGAGGGSIEQRVVELEWPQEFRNGESRTIKVTLKALAGGGFQVSAAEIQSNTVLATPIVMTDNYNTHIAQVTGRVIAPEFEIESANSTDTFQMERGQEVTWRWTLKPKDTGTFVITFGIEVLWQPRDANTAPPIGPYPIWGQAVQTEVQEVLGPLTIPNMSIAGGVLGVLGALSQLPFAGEIFGFLFERGVNRGAERRRQRQAQRRQRRR
ncbi:MAG: hypothetical protein DPW16_08240 [Chloroflexi bacterium]|nr:hypothetical protein [Chloroflexota bacterium]